MASESADSSSSLSVTAPDGQPSAASSEDSSVRETPSKSSASSLSSWARSLKFSLPHDDSLSGDAGKSTFTRFTSGLGLRLSPKGSMADASAESPSTTPPSGVLGSFTKGLVDSSKSAVKAVQVKARRIVSQNKRRYQINYLTWLAKYAALLFHSNATEPAALFELVYFDEDGFDLDMTYITENIIAMGFPAGDISSGILGYVEGFYRNHMEEVIKFFETRHKGRYKVYNLCSERLYDASLFEGKVACFPFDDHNCPPIQLITSFCQSAYSWLKEDLENVVVVHCKAGMARTGLMISSLLLFLKFFPTAEESIAYYNQKRCLDGKGLVLPSQIRYVKYFERILTYFNGENQPGRRCMLRGFRLHRCPYWIRPSITVSDHNGVLFSTKKHPRTKDMMPEDFWFSAPRKGIMVFALPGERGLAELVGDFKIHFHDRQGDFYCWLNTTMMENRKTLSTSELDGFDKRKLPSPGFMVEVVLIDYDASLPTEPKSNAAGKESDGKKETGAAPGDGNNPHAPSQGSGSQEKDDVFSDSEGEASGSSRGRHVQEVGGGHSAVGGPRTDTAVQKEPESVTQHLKQVSIRSEGPTQTSSNETKLDSSGGNVSGFDATKLDSEGVSDFKAIAADASVFTFGDDEDYESE